MLNAWVGCKTRRLRKRVFRTRVESVGLPASAHPTWTGTDEDEDTEVLSIEPRERTRLDVLVVDEDVVGAHGVDCEV